MIRRIALDDTLDHHLCLEALARVISPAVIDTVLQECGAGERRTRKLPSVVTLLFCIAMNLYGSDGLAHVYRRLVLGLRWIWPWDADERAAGRRLLRSVSRGMLLLWDRSFHNSATIRAVRATGAHFLGRLPATVKPVPVHTLADGTQLVRLRPGDYIQRRCGETVLARLIRYTLDDPSRPGHGEEHRLVTSLLNPRRAPAEELVIAYHARWEFELAADELKTHQRPPTPLRSRKPVGVIQEVHALLLAHYVVRAVMADAARTADLAPTRLSFLAALRLVRDAVPDFQRAASTEHPRIYRELLADVAAARLPERRLRSNPPVAKRKMANFGVKGPQHQHWPQPTRTFRDAIALLIYTALGLDPELMPHTN